MLYRVGVSVAPQPPPLPPPVMENPHLFRNPFKATNDFLEAAKAALKPAVPNTTAQKETDPEHFS